MRCLYRLPALLALISTGLLLAMLIQTLGAKRLPPGPVAAWWSRQLLRCFNVQVQISGEAAVGPQLQVANHISWLDMFVLATNGHYRYVAKSEVAGWPVAGTLANAMGTIYIRRGKGGAAPVLEQAAPVLNSGGCFLFFPEGTTSDGQSLLRFHARLFNAACDAECLVQPIALQYTALEGGKNIAPFIGDDSLVAHIWRLLKNRGLHVKLEYCPAILEANSPEIFAQAAHRAIESVLHPGETVARSPIPQAGVHVL